MENTYLVFQETLPKAHKLTWLNLTNTTHLKPMLKGILPNMFGDSVSVWTIVIVFIHYTEFSEEPTKWKSLCKFGHYQKWTALFKGLPVTLKLREINKILLRKTKYISLFLVTKANYKSFLKTPHIYFAPLFRFWYSH